MAEYISSFITGFQDIVARDLVKRVAGIKILNVFDGLIHYQFSGNSRDLEKIIYFNNTFFVLKTFSGKNSNFASLVNAVVTEKKYYLLNKGTFRVRFQKENQFAKVEKNISLKAEETVLRNSKLKLDRLNPSTEIWYSIRRENFAFCGQLIAKREFTEKNLNKGELRPEIAYLMCCFADIKKNDTVLEPFAGYGSIPVQISKRFDFNKLYVSEIQQELVDALLEKKLLQKESICVQKCDAFKLEYLENSAVDKIISDPPWGFYEQIENIELFYEKMFSSFLRVLKDEGTIVVLSASKQELLQAAEKKQLKLTEDLHTLVNGKKAALFKFSK